MMVAPSVCQSLADPSCLGRNDPPTISAQHPSDHLLLGHAMSLVAMSLHDFELLSCTG